MRVSVCLRHLTPGLPAVGCSGFVCLLRPAAVVCPGPLVGIPGQTQAAVHCETVADLFTQVLVSGYFSKISTEQSQMSNPCS